MNNEHESENIFTYENFIAFLKLLKESCSFILLMMYLHQVGFPNKGTTISNCS